MATRQFTRNDYTMAWICALPKTEFVVISAMLDEEHLVLPVADPQDKNIYRIGSHIVVIACLPAEKMRKLSAAIVAKDLLRSFKFVRFGLMVGIGEEAICHISKHEDGATSVDGENDDSEDHCQDEQDIRLGDVVMSPHSKSSRAVL